MSAYQLDRKHFVTIAAFVAKHANDPRGMFVYHPSLTDYHDRYLSGAKVANLLQQQNADSVMARYGEREAIKPIRDAEVTPAKAPSAAEMNGILRSFEYQSCETDDWYGSLPFTVAANLYKLALEVVAKEAAALDADADSKTYSWA